MAKRNRLLSWVTALMAFLALSGCGSWPFAVVGALFFGPEESGSKEDDLAAFPAYEGPNPLLFEEQFELGLSSWQVGGGGNPVTAPGGRWGFGLDPGGGPIAGGEAVTGTTFSLDRGIGISFYARIPVLGVTATEAFGGLKSRICADGLPLFAAGVQLFGGTGQRRFFVNETLVFSDDRLDEFWHAYAIEIGADGVVRFYVDNLLAHRSGIPLDPRYNHRPVSVGGKSGGADVRIDNVRVSGFPPVQTVLFGEGFGRSLAEWQTGSTGGTAAPVIDPVFAGFPAPALNPGGGVAGLGEAMTIGTFDFTPGLALQADLYVPALSTAGLSAWYGLQTGPALTGNRDLAAGVELDATPGVDKTRYYVNDVMVFEENLLTGWHTFVTAIRQGDHRVEFFRDGVLIYTSSALQQVLLAYNNMPVRVGGKAWGGAARIDNVSVVETSLPITPTWNTYSPAGSAPLPVRFSSLMHDSVRNRLIGFAGGAAVSLPNNDLWALDLPALSAWSSLAPAGGPPPAREGHAAVFDGTRNLVVLFGGMDGSGTPLQDTWVLDLQASANGSWADLNPPTAPPARWRHGAVLDGAHERMILFGGSGTGATRFDDLHALDLISGTWSTLSPAGGPPTARGGHTCTLDSAHRRMIVFGGDDGAGPLADVWSLDLSGTGAEAWALLTPSGSPSPPARSDHVAVFDPTTRRLVLFGGVDGTSTPLNDVWVLDLADGADGRWVSLGPLGTAPSPRLGAAGVFDANGKRMLLFGGEDSVQTPLNDFFELKFP